MGDTAGPGGAGQVRGLDGYTGAEADAALDALRADFGDEWELGYDRAGWDAWPSRRGRSQLRATTPEELREKLAAARGTAR